MRKHACRRDTVREQRQFSLQDLGTFENGEKNDNYISLIRRGRYHPRILMANSLCFVAFYRLLFVIYLYTSSRMYHLDFFLNVFLTRRVFH